MTAPDTTTDPLRAFRDALPPRVNAQLRHTARAAVLVHRAVHTNGWTPRNLAAECMRDHNGAINPAGIVMHRLEWCADNPPPDRHTPRVLPFCSPDCADNRGLILDPKTLLPTGEKCECRSAK